MLDDETLSLDEHTESDIFNEELLRSIECMTRACLPKVNQSRATQNYFNSLKVSKVAELFLHDHDFLREFLNRIPFYACYVDHAYNVVCSNERLEKLLGIEAKKDEPMPTRGEHFGNLCEYVLQGQENGAGDVIESSCEIINLSERDYLLCASRLPVFGLTRRRHGTVNVFDLLELDAKRGIDLEYYKKSSTFQSYEKIVRQIRDCIYDSASSVFKLVTQNVANLEIHSIEQLTSVTRISTQLSRKLDKLLKQRGVSLKEWQVLNIVVEFVYPTPSIVSKQLDIANSATSKLLDSLEAKGMIERRYRQEDRRKIRLWYTEIGHLTWLYGKQMADKLMNDEMQAKQAS